MSRLHRALSYLLVALMAVSVVFSALFIYLGATTIGPGWAAWQDHGVPGTYYVTEKSCTKTCTYWGDFQALDGLGSDRANVHMGGIGPEFAVGESLPALDTGASDEVFAPGTTEDVLQPAVMLLFGVAYCLVWIWLVLVRPAILRKGAIHGLLVRRA